MLLNEVDYDWWVLLCELFNTEQQFMLKLVAEKHIIKRVQIIDNVNIFKIWDKNIFQIINYIRILGCCRKVCSKIISMTWPFDDIWQLQRWLTWIALELTWVFIYLEHILMVFNGILYLLYNHCWNLELD